MTDTRLARVLAGAGAFVLSVAGVAGAAGYHHVHLAVPSPTEAVKWYVEHLDCRPIVDRDEAADCGGVEIVFAAGTTIGGSPGTGVNHIGFSFADLTAKMAALEAAGVGGSGVRLQRFEDGSTLRDAPGLFAYGFIFDPWGTRIELVEDPEYLGFHHVHLSSPDPGATLAWYRDTFGGEADSLKGRLDGLLFGDVWLFVSRETEARLASTEGRSVDHLGFVTPDLDAAAIAMRRQGVAFQQDPLAPDHGRSSARQAFVSGPDGVRIEVVESGWAGVASGQPLADEPTAARREPYTAPRTPWGEPDLQGIWTGDPSAGVPLERPLDAEDRGELTVEEAAARREQGTLRSIWGYDREWRDTTLGYVRTAPSTQVAMVIDPPDGRVPPLTPAAEARAALALAGRGGPQPAAGPEDLGMFVRCITRGLPELMMPGVYNNGLQIVQSAGYVAIQKEMIHETRIIPTDGRPHLGANLTQWLGDSRGRWEGDTLVVEVTNFNGRAGGFAVGEDRRESGATLTLVERYTRIGPDTLEYQFTIEDSATWTSPWTGRFTFAKDDQYRVVEYACHEGNYGMTNILSGARSRDRGAEPVGQTAR